MTLEIMVTVDDPQWRRDCPDIETVCRQAAAASCQALDRDAASELSVVLSNDRRVRKLNARYCNADKPTNVLSFDGGDPPPGLPRPIGDVILAYQTVAREAREQAKSLAAHTAHLVVHGVLHLLGHDHQTPADAADMEAREVALLAGLGIADPYLIGAAANRDGPTA